jgi:hypothetical protein
MWAVNHLLTINTDMGTARVTLMARCDEYFDSDDEYDVRYETESFITVKRDDVFRSQVHCGSASPITGYYLYQFVPALFYVVVCYLQR